MKAYMLWHLTILASPHKYAWRDYLNLPIRSWHNLRPINSLCRTRPLQTASINDWHMCAIKLTRIS